ncbi:MAG: hypothetical protein CL843_00830 [Crocinitomicaceae bacterium]|nr:hypothetical protein [Crocinitomicaceae bacterium]|tara:strand:+ start:2857 stop:3861 length:1005 start_codon:yes stop_codon:yes gene_type:complete
MKLIQRQFTWFLGCVFSFISFQVTAQAYTFSHYIAGIHKPEDLVKIPGTQWVLVSAMTTDETSSGSIYVVDTVTQNYRKLFPLSAALNFRFAPHGISLHHTQSGGLELLVVNHGSREAIEFFQVEILAGKPVLTWKNYLEFPKEVWANGVVTAQDGKIYATAMYDPNDAAFLEKFEQAQPTGKVWVYEAATGWKPFENYAFSGANGINLSADERFLYVSEWAHRQLWKFDLKKEQLPQSVQLNFLPDNIRWTTDGTLLVSGQNGASYDVFTCPEISERCKNYTVVRVAPKTMEFEELIRSGNTQFGNGTVALEVGETIWVGNVLTDKVAIFKRD